ncbi:MAG: hypothetical protein ACRD0P_14715 [Stackebrandtia sp.]
MAEADEHRWGSKIADTLRVAARQRARLGQPEAAEHLIAGIPGSLHYEHTRALAEVAVILAAGGHREAAAGFYREAVDAVSSDVSEYHRSFTESALGAAAAVLGYSEAEDRITAAIDAIGPSANPWKHRLSACWALLEAGLEDRAREVWSVDEPGSNYHRRSWLVYLIRMGSDDLVREFCFGSRKSFYRLMDAIDVFTSMGRADLLREYFEFDNHDIDDRERETLAKADRNAETGRPTEADLADLRSAHAELLRTPLGRRREDTKRLAWQAAACGHLSAVLDLLRQLPKEEFNDRAGTAKRALWIAITGFDGEPW